MNPSADLILLELVNLGGGDPSPPDECPLLSLVKESPVPGRRPCPAVFFKERWSVDEDSGEIGGGDADEVSDRDRILGCKWERAYDEE